METVNLKIRAHLWYGTIFLFLEQIALPWRHKSARIHAHVGGSRVDVVTLPDQNGEFGENLLKDFSQRWQGIRQGIRSMALTCSCMPWANGKGEFFQGRKQFYTVNEIWSARTVKLNVQAFAFLLKKLWKKTVYSGIELIWEFPKQCFTITKTYFW